MAEYGNSSEPAEIIPQVLDALKVIDNVTSICNEITVNNHQCKRITNRFGAIGMTLKEWRGDFGSGSIDSGNNVVEYPAFDQLLTVLRKGNALVSKYRGLKASMLNVLSRTENREAFKEIHVELDTLGSQFMFESYTSETERDDMLKADADADLNEILTESLEKVPRTTDESIGQATEGSVVLSKDLKTFELVVSEKIEASDEEGIGNLPHYLKIKVGDVEILPAAKVRRWINQDPVETDGWARVHRGIWIGCDCAVKVFQSGMSEWNRKQLLMEVRSLMKLHHPHIVQLIGFAQDKEKCLIMMELMDNDLRRFMESRKSRHPHQERPFSRAAELDIIIQIAKGMRYLHTQEYVHGELKCSNILVKDFDDLKFIEVKIADLRRSQKLGIFDAEAFNEVRTTIWRPRWTAPEVYDYGLDNQPTHDLLKKTDVYSFGMVCYEVVTGNWPFDGIRGRDHLMKEIRNGKRPVLPDNLDGNLKKLIEECWKSDPMKRPTFEEIFHQLDYIRSSQLTVLGVVKSISQFIRGCLYSPESTNWSCTTVVGQSSRHDSANQALPDFVSIEPDDLKRGDHIGIGAHANVYKATWLGCNFAVKKYKSTQSMEAIQRELTCLIELRHPFLVRLMGLSKDSDHQYLVVMELMDGDLRDLINSRKAQRKGMLRREPLVSFDLLDAVYIISNIASGMAFLHSRNVIHRDLKALNVLYVKHPGFIDVKVADFGTSHIMNPADRGTSDGTGFWRAPEILPPAEEQIDYKAVDVYAFAMTCYEILTGGTPLQHLRATDYAAAKDGARPILPSDLNPDLRQLIEESWDGEPGKRPTFPAICDRLQRIRKGLEPR